MVTVFILNDIVCSISRDIVNKKDIYAPYLPLFASQLLVDSDFKAQRGFCTLYGKKIVNKYMYHRIDLIDNVQVSPEAE